MLENKCSIIENGVLCGEPVLTDGACYDHCVPCLICGDPISKLREGRVCELCAHICEVCAYISVQHIKVYVWPDGTWLYAHEYNDVEDAWRGDDYAIKYFSGDSTYEEVNEAVLSK